MGNLSIWTHAADLAIAEYDAMVAAEVAADGATAFQFVPERIRMPSGGMLAFSTAAGDALPAPLTCIVAVSQSARGYWPDASTMGLPPLCASPDAVSGWLSGEPDAAQLEAATVAAVQHPGLDGTDLGPFPCASCPLAAWGSHNGRGQACKAMRRLLVLPAGWSMPAILTLPPTSVKPWDAYASALRNRSGAYFAVKTALGLERATNAAGIAYAVVKPTVVGRLDAAELAAVVDIRRQYAELVRAMAIVGDDYVDANGDPA